MTEPILLHADEEQIERAALAIADRPAFIVAVCPVDVRLRALAYLRGHVNGLTVSDPVNVTTPDEMFAALNEQVQLDKRVLSLTLENADAAVFDTLNLHREKVLKGGPIVLWLDDVEALRTLRERAPDAYSFRTALLLLRGDGGALPGLNVAESDELVRARNRFARAGDLYARAIEGANLANELSVAGKQDEAVKIARSALRDFPGLTTVDERVIRARLCMVLSNLELAAGHGARSLHWSRQALVELLGVETLESNEVRVELLGLWYGPFICGGRDRGRLLEAQSVAESRKLRGETQYVNVFWLATMALHLGALGTSRSFLNALEAAPSDHIRGNNYLQRVLEAGLQVRKGEFVPASAKFRAIAEHASILGISPVLANTGELDCLFWRGELAALMRQASLSVVDERNARGWTSAIALARGDVFASMHDRRVLVVDAIRAAKDEQIVSGARFITNLAIIAYEAARLSRATIKSILADVDMACDAVMQIAGPDGPEWYPIELNTYRAQLLYLAEKQDDALVLLRQTLELARSTYPDLLPETARVLTDHLLESKLFQEALDVVDAIEPIALERGFLETRGRLLANRILALVGKNTPAAELAPHAAAFQVALDATDSKRITAETLLSLAKRLPKATTFPNPLEVADKAHRLFVAMPMPVEEARCLEIMGDVLVARGRRNEAKSRYLNARARLERHECQLRVPLIEGKLQAS